MTEATRDPFTPRRAAIVSAAIAGFLLVFQPLGIRVDTIIEAAIVAGVAPLNFIVMLAAHEISALRGPARAAVVFSAIAGANLAYFLFWSSEASFMPTLIKIALIVMLSAGAIGFWNRYRKLEAEVIELRARPIADAEPVIVLRGEGESEVFQAPASHLLYILARGNYAEITSRRGDDVAKTLFRSSLAALADQSSGALTRCHRSYLVNLLQARRLISDRKGMRIALANGEEVPVSRSYRTAIKTALLG